MPEMVLIEARGGDKIVKRDHYDGGQQSEHVHSERHNVEARNNSHIPHL